MSELEKLRSDLRRLRLQRRLVRWCFALAAWLLVMLIVALVCLGLDLLLHLSPLQRLLADGTGLSVGVWAWRRHVVPWVRQRESEIDAALLVEREHGLDSELVAALQFDEREVPRSSPPLMRRVVQRGVELSRSIDVFAGFSWKRMRRPALQIVIILGAAAGLTLLFPNHASIFARRFVLLGADRYPSAATIQSMAINGQRVELRHLDEARVSVPAGGPLRVEIRCAGAWQGSARGVLTAVANDVQSEFPLEPVSTQAGLSEMREANDDDAAAAGAKQSTVLAGEHPRLTDATWLEVFVGDTWTDPLRIEVIPRPVIDVQLQVTPPSYAAALAPPPRPGARQVSVLSGSIVIPEVRSVNKPLRSATLRLGAEQFALTAVDAERRHWRLTDTTTPLAAVTESMRYAIDVRDDDGLQLELPWEGFLRIQTDRPPRVALARRVSDPHVLPSARPVLRFGVRDDFGVGRMELVLRASRTDGSLSEDVLPIDGFDDAEPQGREAVDDYVLDLKPYNLGKGDELAVSLRAFDFRGDATPEASVSEPIVLKVTDRSGILKALQDADQQSAEQIDEIIRRELSLGETP